MKILLAVENPQEKAGFGQALAEKCEAELIAVASLAEALELFRTERPRLVVVEDLLAGSGLGEFLRSLLSIDAFASLAVITGMPPEEFHDSLEGFGLLPPVPPAPGPAEAGELAAAWRLAVGG